MAGQETYAPGNCTWYCAGEVWYVQGGWGDAGDWCTGAARSGLQVTGIPTVGTVVSYCRGGGYSPYGHCGVVEEVFGPDRFQVREMNYVGLYVVDHRVSNMWDVCCFILAPGQQPGEGTPPGQGAGGGGLDGIVAEWGLAQNWLNETLQTFINGFAYLKDHFEQV